MEKVLRRTLARAGIVSGYRHICRRCAARKKPYSEEHPNKELRRCPVKDEAGMGCNMKLWATSLPRWMRFHDLRHTTATLLLKARVPMYVVQKILRHADIKTTVGIYGHLDIEDSREALKSMPAARRWLRRFQRVTSWPFPGSWIGGTNGDRGGGRRSAPATRLGALCACTFAPAS